MQLLEKTAVITGGGTGIGQAIASVFVGEGARVVITGRREDKLREVANQLGGDAKALTHALDVKDRAAVSATFDWAEKQLGRIDILVNCAGMNIARRSMAEMTPDEWDEVLATNVTGAYNCIYAVLSAMRKRGDGLIINISSISGKRATRLGGVAYNASKFAMTALGTSVGLEEAAQGIRVTNIYPGEVDTPILEKRPTPVSAEQRARMLQPQDVAAAALLVATLPPRAHIPELVIKPTAQEYA